jgi:hypothetical protein
MKWISSWNIQWLNRAPGLPLKMGVLEILCQSFNLCKRGLNHVEEIRF